MPIIREAGKMIQLYKFKALLLDEFIPLIEYNQTKHAIFLGKISTDSKELTLSPLINRESRTMKPSVLTTESRSIRLPFTVKKGCSSSLDKDGIVTIKFSIDSKEIRLVGSNPVAACLDSEMEVEIDINSQSDVEFNVDFYASDDIEDEKNVGEAKNVHCGRFKVCFNYKIITDWPNVAPVIQKDKFVGWNYPGVRENCFHYALHQLKVAGYWVKSERWNKKWDGTKELNDYIYQLYLEKDVAGMKKGVQTDQFDKGVEYLKKAIQEGKPVLVGVDDDTIVDNDDMTTEHFITIVGMGGDSEGKYFLFYDNAVGHGNSDVGSSSKNKLYCKASQCLIEGKGDPRNEYIQGTTKKKYIVTQIRETK